jgi:hypothetical protein
MIPAFERGTGYLPTGIHLAGWQEFYDRFNGTSHRRLLLRGMKSALLLLRDAGCETAYVGGSFVTKKTRPKDFDGCWEEGPVDLTQLDPIFLPKLIPGLGWVIDRLGQLHRFRGELFPAGAIAEAGCCYRDFFQRDRDDVPKGVVRFDLRNLT